MSLPSTMLLGFIAGVTILLGLLIGRLRSPAPTLRALLNATAIGVLLFLVWDVFSAAWAPIDDALTSAHDGKGGLGVAAGCGVLFAAGLAAGLLSLVYYEKWIGAVALADTGWSRRRHRRPILVIATDCECCGDGMRVLRPTARRYDRGSSGLVAK